METKDMAANSRELQDISKQRVDRVDGVARSRISPLCLWLSAGGVRWRGVLLGP